MQTFETKFGPIKARIHDFKIHPQFDFIVHEQPDNLDSPEKARNAPRLWNVSERITARTITTGHNTEAAALAHGRESLKARNAHDLGKAISSHILGDKRNEPKSEFILEVLTIIAALFTAAQNHKPEANKNEISRPKRSRKSRSNRELERKPA